MCFLLVILYVDNWPWVTYFKYKKKKKWIDGETKHTVLYSDVHKKLEAPDIHMEGRNLHI